MNSGFKKTIFLVFFTTVILTAAQGRVGDLEATSESRYGKPSPYTAFSILEGAKTKSYKYKGWTIIQAYINGRCIRADYHKQHKTGQPIHIQTDELAAVMLGEGDGGKWEKSLINPLYGSHSYKCSNGKTSMIRTGKLIIRIDAETVPQYLADFKRKKEAQRKKNIPNF